MLKLGILQTFIDMARIFLVGAEVLVCINGAEIGTILIKQGVWQGYPLAP